MYLLEEEEEMNLARNIEIQGELEKGEEMVETM